MLLEETVNLCGVVAFCVLGVSKQSGVVFPNVNEYVHIISVDHGCNYGSDYILYCESAYYICSTNDTIFCKGPLIRCARLKILVFSKSSAMAPRHTTVLQATRLVTACYIFRRTRAVYTEIYAYIGASQSLWQKTS